MIPVGSTVKSISIYCLRIIVLWHIKSEQQLEYKQEI